MRHLKLPGVQSPSKFSVVAALAFICATNASAATIFESATLGQTGVVWSNLTSGAVPSINANYSVYSGVRFHLNQPVITSQIGGHFVASSSGTFFGAIVKLAGENDTPDSFDFTTSDFIGSTLLTFPITSGEVFGELALPLSTGWHALVFGSGLFGATGGAGASILNGNDIGTPTYFGAQPFSGSSNWIDTTSGFSNGRYIINGQIVPEHSSIVLAFALLSSLSFKRLYKYYCGFAC